jgi:hypothetical protein
MKLPFWGLIVFSIPFFCLDTNCKWDKDNKDGMVAADILPKDVKPANVVLTDVNCWVEGKMFYAVGLVDSREPFWLKIWLKLGVVDAKNQIVPFKSDSFCLVDTHADALYPRGRTAFFASWKLADLKGVPDSIYLKGAQSATVDPGAILIAQNLGGGIKVSFGDTSSTPALEKYVMVNGVVENPLPLNADNPGLSLLLYGTDHKLWFTQNLNLNVDASYIKVKMYGPMTPNEKRNFGMHVYYDSLPQAIRTKRIGRIDFLGYEKRNPKHK